MVYDNESLDMEVGFIEKNHKYVLKKDKGFKFNSVTTLIKDFSDEFDAIQVATRLVKNPKSMYYKQNVNEVVSKWETYGKLKSGEGTKLHEYGEMLLNGDYDEKIVKNVKDLPKAKWVPEAVKYLKDNDYIVAKTELLVYNTDIKLAGQSDIILKKKRLMEDVYDYMIYDWKFLSKPIDKKSYYNPKTGQYRKMKGVFKHLLDCNWIHYSIQLAIYQTLTGEPEKIKEKVLVCINDDKWSFIPAYPMRVYWDENNQLQAVYELFNGKFYDSRYDTIVNRWPSKIRGR